MSENYNKILVSLVLRSEAESNLETTLRILVSETQNRTAANIGYMLYPVFFPSCLQQRNGSAIPGVLGWPTSNEAENRRTLMSIPLPLLGLGFQSVAEFLFHSTLLPLSQTPYSITFYLCLALFHKRKIFQSCVCVIRDKF